MDRQFVMHRPARARWTGRALAAGAAARQRGERRALGGPGEAPPAPAKFPEIGGPEGPEPTRYGDWERKGICYDF